MNKKIIVFAILFAVFCSLSTAYAMGGGMPADCQSRDQEKIVYIDRDNDSFTLWVSDNNDEQTNRKKIFEGKVKDNWYRYDLYYVLGGAQISGKMLYYCDTNEKAIYAYDLINNKRIRILNNAFYPFLVWNKGAKVIYAQIPTDSMKSEFSLFDKTRGKTVEVSVSFGGRNFTRPRKVLRDRYVLFDTNACETESNGPSYFLYDIEASKLVPEENYDEYGYEINSMNRIALYKDMVAYMDSKGKSIGGIVSSMNTLYLLDLKTMENKKLYHNDDVDIRYIVFKDKGQIIELLGQMAIAKGAEGDFPYVLKPIVIICDLNKQNYLIKDRNYNIPQQDSPVNCKNEIGVYVPKP